MKVIIPENKIYTLCEDSFANNQYKERINTEMMSLENLINNSGYVMYNIENDKYYMVYELFSLSKLIGRRYCLCRLIKDNKPYGQIYVKSMKLFKIKEY